MAFAAKTTIENDYWTAIATALDAGSGAGKLKLYGGTYPGKGTAPGGGNPLILTWTLADPAAASITGGVITFDTVSPATVLTADAHTWARLEDSAGTFVADLDTGLTGSGAALELNAASYSPGGLVALTGLTLSFPVPGA